MNYPSLEYIVFVGAPVLLQQKEKLIEKVSGIYYKRYGLTKGLMTVLNSADSPA